MRRRIQTNRRFKYPFHLKLTLSVLPIFLLSTAVLFYLLTQTAPGQTISYEKLYANMVPFFILDLFLVIATFVTLVFQNLRRGVLFALFIVVYLLLRLNGLTHLFFLFLLLALFSMTEIFFMKRK